MDSRHPSIADPSESVLVLVDCQERLWKVIHDRDALEARLANLLKGAAILGIPVIVTEQNPKGLGETVPELKKAASEATVIAKTAFSCFGEDGFRDHLRALDRDTLVLAGVEAHICVAQTALDGLAAGYRVHAVADGCGTRVHLNHELGLRRMDRAGAVTTSIEAVLFDWMEHCEHPEFRTVVGLLK